MATLRLWRCLRWEWRGFGHDWCVVWVDAERPGAVPTRERGHESDLRGRYLPHLTGAQWFTFCRACGLRLRTCQVSATRKLTACVTGPHPNPPHPNPLPTPSTNSPLPARPTHPALPVAPLGEGRATDAGVRVASEPPPSLPRSGGGADLSLSLRLSAQCHPPLNQPPPLSAAARGGLGWGQLRNPSNIRSMAAALGLRTSSAIANAFSNSAMAAERLPAC